MISKQDLFNKCTTQTSVFKSSFGEIKLRQLSIAESEEVAKIQKDASKTLKDTMIYTLQRAMIEPTFFTDEELKDLGIKGQEFMFEVFSEVPLVGMSEKEREEYKKRMEEFLKAKKEDVNEEDTEKK